MRIFLTISYLHPGQETPHVILWLRNQNYIFNMPALYQRFFKTKGINFDSKSQIFITNLTSTNINGFLGFISSLSSNHFNYQTKIYGPLGLNEFLYNRRFSLGLHSLKYSSYNFHNIKEKYASNKVLLGIKDKQEIVQLTSKHQVKEILNSFDRLVKNKEALNDASIYVDQESNIFSDKNARIIPVFCSYDEVLKKKLVISYICYIKNWENAKIKPQVIRYYDLSYEDIKNVVTKKEITLKNGEKLTLDQLIPPSSGEKECAVIFIDCPNITIMKQIINNEHFNAFYETNNKKNFLKTIVHIVPLSILEQEEYQEWIKKFDKRCQHIFCCKEVQTINFKNNFQEIKEKMKNLKLLSLLNKYFPDHFPATQPCCSLTSNIKEKLLKLKRNIPNIIFPNYYNFYEIAMKNDQNLINAKHSNSNFTFPFLFKETMEFINYYQKYKKMKNNYKNIPRNFDPEIVFLGTNSSQPINVRNVSSIYLNIKNFGIILDCGEGTYFQMQTHFGSEKIEEVLLNINAIYISHFHLDHNLGITELIIERNRVLKKMNRNSEENKLFLIIPPNLLPSIEDFRNLIEDFDGFNYILTTHLSDFNRPIANYNSNNQKINLDSGELTVDEFYLENLLSTVLQKYLNPCRNNLLLLKKSLDIAKISFKTVSTPHCQDSHALIIEHAEGVKIVYSGDTKYSEELIEGGKNATILIHEATFLDREVYYNHSTVSDAIAVGRKMNAWRTILTHFSRNSYNPEMKKTIKIFEKDKGKNNELEIYAESQVVLAVDHLRAKVSEFEYLPFMNQCMNLIHPMEDF